LKSANTPKEVETRALNALKAFAKLASLVATAWKTWNEREMPPVGPPEPGDRYKYDEKQVSGADDYMISGIDNRITRVVVFKNTAAANEKDAAKPKEQASLDILNKENAWPELRITRNETLFGDVVCMEGSSPRTNPSFVYHTPWVRFAEILKPRIEYGRRIDIAKLPKEQGKTLKPSCSDRSRIIFRACSKASSRACPIPVVRSRPNAACSLRAATNTISTSRRTKTICS
jgi:hypothetical protein